MGARASAHTGQRMKFLSTLSVFAFTMILSLIAFTCTAIVFSGTMGNLLTSVQNVHDQVLQLYLADNYMVWMDILLQPNLLVLLGFSIAVRLLLTIVSSAFDPGESVPPLEAAAPLAASSSAFGSWG